MLWGLMWRSNNLRDGKCEHLMYESCLPLLFATKREATAYAKSKYGYIKTRKYLREEPHGWRMPKPVRVTVTINSRDAAGGG